MYSLFGTATALAALLVLLGAPSPAPAQTVVNDNFDSYSSTAQFTAAGWILSSLNPALVSTTFPATSTGKGVRIQANPFPSAGAPAVGMWYRTNEYTDFYVSIDIASWPGTDKNQAMVLFARLTDASTGTVLPNQNPANAQGLICNYDAAQHGENPGNRRQGQFQINRVDVGFETETLAVSETTFVPGRSYRIVFKGVGTDLTAQAYDLFDLTTPLVTLQAYDYTGFGDFTNGACGFLSFSRQGTDGTADATYDNYYSGPADPNPAPAPALAHPVAGTPQVVTRTPAARFKNFHPVASGISFNARTFSANEINASATRLYLNGADVSSALAPFPANGNNLNFSTAAGTLAANTVYSARLELVDTGGTQKSTNTFWFDTFTDAFLATAPVKTIECEDYNYSNGVYQLDPIPVSGMDKIGSMQVNGYGVGYFDVNQYYTVATEDVDYFSVAGEQWFQAAEYRTDDLADSVMITQGSVITTATDEAGDIQDRIVNDWLTTNGTPYRIHDTQRSKYTATNVWEYQVRLTQPGDWFNYTRGFANTNYYVFLRCASFGATTLYLDRVTSDITTSNQTTVRLGTFNVANHIMRLNYTYEPLMVGNAPAIVSLSGLNTLRLTRGGTAGEHNRMVVMDYLLFVPTDQAVTIFDDFNDGNDTEPPWDRYDPIGTGSWSFPGGNTYRIQSAPSPDPLNLLMGRAGSFLAGPIYTDFYVAADIVDFDDTIQQVFGLAARIQEPGLGTTDGYLFTWEPGGGPLPGTDNGDLDIVVLENEWPVQTQIENESGSLHLEKGKSYRFAFMGIGTNLVAEVYELPNTTTPIKRLTAAEKDLYNYASGQVGFLVANNHEAGGYDGPADATFDNFLATTAEPRLIASAVGSAVKLTWPLIPFRLQASPSLTSPSWTTIATGIAKVGGQYEYAVPAGAGAAQFYRLVYP